MKRKITAALIAVQSIAASILFAGIAYADTPTTSVTIVDPGGDPITWIVQKIQKFGGWLLLIAGAIAVVFLVIGGVRYVVSAGNPTQTEGAKKTIIYALIGLGVIIAALVLISLVGSLFGATTP